MAGAASRRRKVQLPGEGRPASGREEAGTGTGVVGSGWAALGFTGRTMERAEQASVTGFADLHFEIWPPRKKCLTESKSGRRTEARLTSGPGEWEMRALSSWWPYRWQDRTIFQWMHVVHIT